MNRQPLLPVSGGIPDDMELAKADARDVYRELHKLATQEYEAWKEKWWANLYKSHGEMEQDEHGWLDREAQDAFMRAKNKKAESLRNKRDNALMWWWSCEQEKVGQQQRVRRIGEGYLESM